MKMLNLILMLLLMSSSLAYASFNPNIFQNKTTSISPAAQVPQVPAVDINQADVKELTSLKGIGIKTAEAIVAYRQQHGLFKSVNDLAQVQGFSAKKLATLLKKNDHRIVAKTEA